MSKFLNEPVKIDTGFLPKTPIRWATEEQPIFSSIMDIDRLADNDGTVERSDFFEVLQKYKEHKGKIEELYIDFCLQNPKNSRDSGDYKITEVVMPFCKKGESEVRKFIFDKKTGKKLMENTTRTSEKDGIVTVTVNKKHYGVNDVKSIDSEFQYDVSAIENYIINEAKDNYGNTIRKFSEIPNIRNIPEEERTAEQKKILQEFDNLIKYVVDTGVDYGVDPKLVLSIIQQEVGFDGLSSRVVGVNGKGYMQLTSAPIKDFLGYGPDKKYHATKISQYGPEMAELLISRGFNVHDAKDNVSKERLYQEIMNYLIENKDPEFNIRLGTQVLAYYMNKSEGDVRLAARNYNGNIQLRDKYADHVERYYDTLGATVPQDSTYVYQKRQFT